MKSSEWSHSITCFWKSQMAQVVFLFISTCISRTWCSNKFNLPVIPDNHVSPSPSLILILKLGPRLTKILRLFILLCIFYQGPQNMLHAFYDTFSPGNPGACRSLPFNHQFVWPLLRSPPDFIPMAEHKTTFTTFKGHRRARNWSLVSPYLVTYSLEELYPTYLP